MRTVFSTLLFSLIFFSACKKESPTTGAPTYSIQGLWIGTYAVNGQPALGDRYFSFVIKPDGTIIVDGQASGVQSLSTGTWNLNNNILSCNYTVMVGLPNNVGTNQSATATFDNSGKLTGGVWTNIKPTGSSGTFTLTRVN